MKAFWQRYLATLPSDHPHHKAHYLDFAFGDSPELADELAALVLAGLKTATASLLMLDSQDRPLAVLETTEVKIVPFAAVDERQAYAEGEGDRSLAFWREAHRQFFGRSCARIGRTLSDDMPIICEHFRVLYQEEPQ